MPIAIATLALLGSDAALTGPARAHDLGRFGEAWPVIEPDLLTTIDQRLRAAQGSGELDRLNRAFAARAEARVRHPEPVAGLSPATQSRRWTFDPAIMLDADVRDAKGQLIAAKGTRVDPLAFVRLPRALLFVDGERAEELEWAKRQGDDTRVAIVLTNGAPFDLMKALQRRIWFDQGGRLTARFGVVHTPARVFQQGATLVVEEVALPGSGTPS